MATTKKNATSLRELKASGNSKKKSFFSFLNMQPKFREKNNSNVKLKGFYSKKDGESTINTISASVSGENKLHQNSDNDIYEEIHIECSESDQENESVKNLETKKSPILRKKTYNRESSDDEEEEDEENQIEENESTESIKKFQNQEQKKVNQTNQIIQPAKIPVIHYDSLKFEETNENPLSSNNKAVNNNEKDLHLENKLKFESILNDLKGGNNGQFRARSKSLHPNFNPINSERNVKFDERRTSTAIRAPENIKRRTMIDVIKHIGHNDENESKIETKTNFKTQPRTRFDSISTSIHLDAQSTYSKSNTSSNSDQINDSGSGYSSGKIHKIHSSKVHRGKEAFEMHAINVNGRTHNKYEPTEKKRKSTPKIAVGFSIIYGVFLLFVGIFLSLDTLAGELGSQKLVNTIFFAFLFVVSISWIIFLLFDISSYTKKLNAFMAKTCDAKNVIVRTSLSNQGGFYGILKNGSPTDIYETKDEILKNINDPTYNNIKDQRKYDAEKSVLVDFDSKKFNGYLIDKNQPYNMYLKVGIGAFCLVTLLQCCVEMAEAIENFVNGRNECNIETYEAVISFLQFIFSSVQFLFIFSKGNIVINSNSTWASILTMHLAITNFIVWFKNILIETILEYYEHLLEKNLEIIHEHMHGNSTHSNHALNTQFNAKNFASNDTGLNLLMIMTQNSVDYENSINLARADAVDSISNITYIDCHDPNLMFLKAFAFSLKPYMYPASIEFSITCATIFLIMWYKIGKKSKSFSLPPTKKNFEGVGSVSMPNANRYLMLDCSRTSKGLFFGVIVFVGTLLSSILFIVYNSKKETKNEATLLSEASEIILLLIALVITWYAFIEIRKHYQKVIPQFNAFDIVLEIFSLFGVYAFSINSLIALTYGFFKDYPVFELEYFEDYFNHLNSDHSINLESTGHNHEKGSIELTNEILAAFASCLSIIQGTLQTLFILECLRRYAADNKSFMIKPARELITALLLVNVSLWLFDTLSAKRFDSKEFLISYFGILKWSIINAFSSPIAIFYRFHSSVCLSDIWYGLYYGEHEEESDEEQGSSDKEESF